MSENTGKCGGLDGLVAWYPTGTLDDDERRQVETHMSGCEACAQLLRFGADIRESLSPSRHPEEEAIVLFAEDRSSLAREERDRIEAHVAECGQCREQVEVLDAVDQADRPDVSTAPGRTEPTWVERFWRRLGQSVFSPVPAAAYLVIAIVAAGLYFVSRDGGSTPGVGVVIVPDEGGRVRSAQSGESDVVTIDTSSSRLLLFELTRLESPPEAEARYAVTIRRAGANTPVVAFDVEGRTFLDNYTIGYVLQPGTLGPGQYTVEVVAPGGEVVFQSSLYVR
jgi:anti-sigma-K factor RskA